MHRIYFEKWNQRTFKDNAVYLDKFSEICQSHVFLFGRSYPSWICSAAVFSVGLFNLDEANLCVKAW